MAYGTAAWAPELKFSVPCCLGEHDPARIRPQRLPQGFNGIGQLQEILGCARSCKIANSGFHL